MAKLRYIGPKRELRVPKAGIEVLEYGMEFDIDEAPIELRRVFSSAKKFFEAVEEPVVVVEAPVTEPSVADGAKKPGMKFPLTKQGAPAEETE